MFPTHDGEAVMNGPPAKITHESEEHRMRDSRGRERSENYYTRDGQLKLLFISLSDPEAHTRTTLFLRDKTARIEQAPERPPRTPEQLRQLDEARTKAAAALPKGEQQPPQPGVERLPPQTIAGVDAEGIRFTRIIPQGKEGNDREIKIVSENWISRDLNITLRSVLDDPRTSNILTEVTELRRVEPDASLFEIPSDYKIVESAH